MKIREENELSFKRRYGISLSEQYSEMESYTDSAKIEDNSNVELNEGIYNIPIDARIILFVGFSNGNYLRKILRIIRRETKMIVYEPDQRLFLYLCSKYDFSDLITNTKLEMIIGGQDAFYQLEKYIDNNIGVLNIRHLYMRIAPGYEKEYEDLIFQLKEKINHYCLAFASELNTLSNNSRVIYKNHLYALSILHNNSLISHLAERMKEKNVPIILVGAGPSLDKNVSELAHAKGRALIISCTHAVPTIKKYGIEVDLVAMVDMEEGIDYCKDDIDRNYRMLFHPNAASGIQKLYDGNSIYFDFNTNRFPIKGLGEEVHGFSSGGSVITSIMSLFIQLGFYRFVLVGMDLAYSMEGKTHSGEYSDTDSNARERYTEGINGNLVKTRADWIVFKEYIENLIISNSELKIIDSTEGGAYIKGTQVIPLKNVIEEELGEQYPVDEWLENLPKGFVNDLREIESLFESYEKKCANMQIKLDTAISLCELLIERLEDTGNSDKDISDYISKYDRCYHEVIEDDDAVPLWDYCADIVQEYADKAQFVEEVSNLQKKIKLEFEFFVKAKNADCELRSFLRDRIKDIRSFKDYSCSKILENDEVYLLNRYGLSQSGVSDKEWCLSEITNLYFPIDYNKIYGIANTNKDTLVYIIMGLPKADSIMRFLKMISLDVFVIIYEPDICRLLYTISREDYYEIINKRKLRLINDLQKFEKEVNNVLQVYNYDHLQIFVSYDHETKLSHEKSVFVNVIQSVLYRLEYERVTWDYYGRELCKNELTALSQLKDNFLLNDLFHLIADHDIPVIIVSAGPSLKKNMNILKKAAGKAIIVAVDHAVDLLDRNGIGIDFVAKVDGGINGEEDIEYLRYDTNREHYLIISATAGRSVQKKYMGRCIYFDFSDEVFQDSVFKMRRLTPKKGGSVATEIFETFAAEGFRVFILVGQDLAYDDHGNSHAQYGEKKTADDETAIFVDGIDGERVKTRRDWLFFLEYYERILREHKELTVIDATEGGARISGTIVMTLDQALHEYCKTEYPINIWKEKLKKTKECYNRDVGKEEIERQKRYLDKVGKMIQDIIILNDRLKAEYKFRQIIPEQWKDECNKYNGLYHDILDGDESGLLCYYSQDVINHYISDALIMENDEIKKLELELTLFSRLREKWYMLSDDLKEY